MITNLIFLTVPNFPVFYIQNYFGSKMFYEPRQEVMKWLGSEPRPDFQYCFSSARKLVWGALIEHSAIWKIQLRTSVPSYLVIMAQ